MKSKDLGKLGWEKMYKCGKCNRFLEHLDPTTNRCPYCESRILFKVRPDTVRKVKAR